MSTAQIIANFDAAVEQVWQHWEDETESWLPFPHPSLNNDSGLSLAQQANANRQCQQLAEFWQSEVGGILAEAIKKRAVESLRTPAYWEWWNEYNKAHPVYQVPYQYHP